MKTKKALYIAFSFLLSMMLLLIVISLLAMQAINDRLGTIATNNLIKVELASNMLHAARERSILLHRMVLIDDPFDRDELALRIDTYGAEFGNNRADLKNLPLSKEEKDILDEQGRLTSIAIPNQRLVIDLVAEDRLIQAKDALINAAMPAQDRVFEELKKLIELQKKYASKAFVIATDTYNESRLAMIALGIGALLLSILIANIFIKRITEAEHKLHKEKEKALVTFRSIGDAVITIDSSGLIEYINNKAEQMIGLYANDVIGKQIGDVFRAYDVDNQRHISDFIDLYLSGDINCQISPNIELASFDGSKYNITTALSPIMGESNNVNGMVITFHDITRSSELMRQIKHQATHDALTGLLNRREFERKVKQALSLYERNTNHAFCIVDLDRFKMVNDACGHQAGDELLRQLSELMKAAMRKGDLIARIGGDEFAIFLSNIDTEQARTVSNKLLETISHYRFLWEDRTFRIGASIGLVDASPEVSEYEFLYLSADSACYIAKNEGRNRVHVMSIEDSVITRKKEETDWLVKINKALDEYGFHLYGQPIVPVSLRAEGCYHVEILIRMIEDGKVISPMAFIPTAESYGLMHRIDHYVLEQVCNFLKSRPLDHTIYAVNLSGQTLSSITAMENLIEILESSAIGPGRICFEVTETAAIANLENARSFMQSIQELGCYTALDDFGSGLSSYSYLKNLPLDYIKIDGVFVSNMVNDRSSAIMVDAIHSVGKKLGLMTIAEYVENEETVEMLRQIGVDFAQGYFYSKPELYIPPPYTSMHEQDL